jgi:ribosome-associated protein
MLDPRVKHTATIILKACLDRKGKDIIGLNFENIESYTDFVIIASGTNTRQVKAIADLVQQKVFEERGLHPLGVEGYESASWILVDFGAVICHAFLAETRAVYHLEDMWPQVQPLNERELKGLLLEQKPRRHLRVVKPRVGKPKRTALRKSTQSTVKKKTKPVGRARASKPRKK